MIWSKVANKDGTPNKYCIQSGQYRITKTGGEKPLYQAWFTSSKTPHDVIFTGNSVTEAKQHCEKHFEALEHPAVKMMRDKLKSKT